MSFASQVKIGVEFGNECSWNTYPDFPITGDMIALGLSRGNYGTSVPAYAGCQYAIDLRDIDYVGKQVLRSYNPNDYVLCMRRDWNFVNLFRAKIPIEANNPAHAIPENGTGSNDAWEAIWFSFSFDALLLGARRAHSEESVRSWSQMKPILGDRFIPILGGWQYDSTTAMMQKMTFSSPRSGGLSPADFASDGLGYAIAPYYGHNLGQYGVTGYDAFPPSLQAQYITNPAAWKAGFKAACIQAIDSMIAAALVLQSYLGANFLGAKLFGYEFNKHYNFAGYPNDAAIKALQKEFERSDDFYDVQLYMFRRIADVLGGGPFSFFELIGQGWNAQLNDADITNPTARAMLAFILERGLNKE
jgi:hypothetical protein